MSSHRVNMRDSKLCGVCASYCWNVRGADGAYRHVFFCDECELARAKRIGAMSGIELHEMQQQALADASPRLGAYLDKLGKTELTEMSGAEWLAFLTRVVDEYSFSMRTLTGARL